MTRNGKIARLPHFIREELNQRLFDGEPGVKLIDWLHEQDVVWEMLDENDFDEITEQNLSEWKAGGYQSWVDNREARELVMRMTSRADDLGESVEGANLGDCVATLLMVELMKVARVLVQQEEDSQKRWKELRRVGRELSRHRRDRARDIRSDINKKRCEWAEEDREEAKAEKHAAWVKKQRLAPYKLPLSVAILSSGENEDKEVARSRAARQVEIEHDMPEGFLEQQDNGVWMWEEDKWVWYVDRRKEGRGFVQEEWVRCEENSNSKNQTSKGKGGRAKGKKGKRGKQPESKHQVPEEYQKPTSKAVDGRETKAEGQAAGDIADCRLANADLKKESAPTDVGGYKEGERHVERGEAGEESRPTTSGDRPNPTESDQIRPFNE